MAGLAVETTARLVSQFGPNIIRSGYWETHVLAGQKSRWLDRVQSAPGPHKKAGDPHIAGRALDIVLRASIRSERLVADELVGIFLKLRKEMGFISLIYNGSEWNSAGVKMARLGDAVNRHVTHIHIEWSDGGVGGTGFQSALKAAIQAMSPSLTDYEFD
jgi:hypothetical protein